VAFADELRRLAASKTSVEYLVVPSRPGPEWTGPAGRVNRDLLSDLLPADRDGWSYFVCGSPGMAASAEAALRSLGVGRADIRVERYALA
jgi:NAD(P)H-flavin reductase